MTTSLYYDKLARPPKDALKTIQAGRLKGKTDIKPQWRYRAMTEIFGPCGIGWKYSIDRLWNEPGPDSQVFAFVQISLHIKQDGEWSDAIPGIGGHMLIPKEKSGLHANDEAYKMATTDALSTAMKMLGVAADIYSGNWDGSKYINEIPSGNVDKKPETPMVSNDQLRALNTVMGELGIADRDHKMEAVNLWLENKGHSKVESSKELTKAQASALIELLKAELNDGTEGDNNAS